MKRCTVLRLVIVVAKLDVLLVVAFAMSVLVLISTVDVVRTVATTAVNVTVSGCGAGGPC